MPIFKSFQSTVTPLHSRRVPRDWNLLADPNTGAPAGIQNPNANGADGIWTPIDLTAAQIASPDAEMLADLNAVYRLNVAPYTRYISNGTALVQQASAASFSPRLVQTGGVGGNGATAAFTNQTPVITEVYIAEVFVPGAMSVTGVAVFNGTAVSGNMKVGLADASGAIVATSASTAASGTSAYQRVPFTAPASLTGGIYYVLTFYDNTTQRANAHTVGSFGAAVQTGQVYATGFTTITPPTTFTTAVGPVASLY